MLESYIYFLERHLGRIKRGWQEDGGEGVQVVQYEGEIYEGSSVYSTLGLSKYCLEGKEGGEVIRHEVFFISRDDYGTKNIPTILQQISNVALWEGKSYLRGDYIKMKGEVFEGTGKVAMYVSNPVYFEESFSVYDNGKDIPIVSVWVFPIFEDEVKMLSEKGWNYFEDKLEEVDPDLIDLYRESIV